MNSLSIELPSYLPLFDPDYFHEASFYKDLERIGYTQIMLGGTGSTKMREAVQAIRDHTQLSIIMHPSNPGEVWPVDLILLGAVMNSNSHYTRPFGSGAVAIAKAIFDHNVPFLPVAYFVMGESTARWYSDAFLIHSKKIILSYCLYSYMVGYRWLLLDYEDPNINIDVTLIQQIKRCSPSHLIVTDEFTPETAAEALVRGVDTVVTPSNIYEENCSPITLAKEFYNLFQAPTAGCL